MARRPRIKNPIIYGLRDPRDGRIRYVGQSINGVDRARHHVYKSQYGDSPHKDSWVASLKSAGLRYEIVVLEADLSPADLDEAEKKWIRIGRQALGDDLTNATKGGGGNAGWLPSSSWRINQSLAQKGMPKSPETIANMKASFTSERRKRHGELARGKKRTPEQIAKRVAACKPWTPERLARHLQIHVGRKLTDESKRKIAERAMVSQAKRSRDDLGRYKP